MALTSGRKPLVMFVEDDEGIRDAVADTLEEEDFQVDTAADGLKALARLVGLGRLPDVIVLDLVMPNLDGREFLEMKRSSAVLAEIPVLVLTATPDTSGLADVAEVLRKPIEREVLVSAITRLLAAKAQAVPPSYNLSQR
jgi:CheY-like chemotaxis protein